MSLSRHDFTPAELKAQLGMERRGDPFLIYREPDSEQQLLALEGERISVGRGGQNELALIWDVETSRVHALLERLGGSWTVVDDRLSRNGTFVNGTRVQGRRRLDDRDLIRIGATDVLFRDPSRSDAETPPVASRAAIAGVSQAQKRVLNALCRPLLQAAGQPGAPPSNPEMADELNLSVEAVRTHLKTLFRLFEIPNLPQNQKRAELARRALASGVVSFRDMDD